MSEHSSNEKIVFGFWVYLMTDLLMFAVLFAAFVALRHNTFGGPGGKELFNLNFVLAETLLLLLSSFTAGMSLIAAKSAQKGKFFFWIALTILLGAAFLGLELTEFSKLVAEGNGPGRSAFLSSYFALVGTHGLHIAAGLLWILVLIFYIFRRGLDEANTRKLTLFSLFWHFLDIVWIFIFTIVYLMA